MKGLPVDFTCAGRPQAMQVCFLLFAETRPMNPSLSVTILYCYLGPAIFASICVVDLSARGEILDKTLHRVRGVLILCNKQTGLTRAAINAIKTIELLLKQKR